LPKLGKVAKAVAKQKCHNVYIKAQIESPKHQHQTTFETLKYLQQTILTAYLGEHVKYLLKQKVAKIPPFLLAISSFLKVILGIRK